LGNITAYVSASIWFKFLWLNTYRQVISIRFIVGTDLTPALRCTTT
jgi:hypothetical protein